MEGKICGQARLCQCAQVKMNELKLLYNSFAVNKGARITTAGISVWRCMVEELSQGEWKWDSIRFYPHASKMIVRIVL